MRRSLATITSVAALTTLGSLGLAAPAVAAPAVHKRVTFRAHSWTHRAVPQRLTLLAPVLADDTATTPSGTPVLVPVLTNDLHVTAAKLTVGAPAHGTAAVSGLGVLYTPAAGFAGLDAVSYKACTTAGCGTAVLRVTVLPPAPTAGTGLVRMVPGSTTTVNLLSHVIGTGIDPTKTVVSTPSSYLKVTVSDGLATITAPATYAGGDGFQYRACDVSGQCVTGLLQVLVDTAPVAAADSFVVPVGASANQDLVANDSDADRFIDDVAGDIDPYTTRLISQPADGTATLVGSVVTYTRTTAGTDTFGYQVCDKLGLCSTATVTVS